MIGYSMIQCFRKTAITRAIEVGFQQFQVLSAAFCWHIFLEGSRASFRVVGLVFDEKLFSQMSKHHTIICIVITFLDLIKDRFPLLVFTLCFTYFDTPQRIAMSF